MDSINPFITPDSYGAEHEDSQEVMAERAIADAGQSQAFYNYNQKLLEQKERELMESIALNYGRIRDVERELGNLQLQLKLTSGPKKHALEMLRKKIETQNERVVYVRARHTAAKAAFEKLDVELKREEAAKDQLCGELNTLVQQAAKAQMDKLEELKTTLEGLYNGIMPGQVGAQQALGQRQQQQAPPELQSGAVATSQLQAPAGGDAGPSSGVAGCEVQGDAAIPSPSSAAVVTAEAEQQQQQQERREQERRAVEERRRRDAEAAAARSRHVSLTSSSGSPGCSASPTPTAAAPPPRATRASGSAHAASASSALSASSSAAGAAGMKSQGGQMSADRRAVTAGSPRGGLGGSGVGGPTAAGTAQQTASNGTGSAGAAAGNKQFKGFDT